MIDNPVSSAQNISQVNQINLTNPSNPLAMNSQPNIIPTDTKTSTNNTNPFNYFLNNKYQLAGRFNTNNPNIKNEDCRIPIDFSSVKH